MCDDEDHEKNPSHVEKRDPITPAISIPAPAGCRDWPRHLCAGASRTRRSVIVKKSEAPSPRRQRLRRTRIRDRLPATNVGPIAKRTTRVNSPRDIPPEVRIDRAARRSGGDNARGQRDRPDPRKDPLRGEGARGRGDARDARGRLESDREVPHGRRDGAFHARTIRAPAPTLDRRRQISPYTFRVFGASLEKSDPFRFASRVLRHTRGTRPTVSPAAFAPARHARRMISRPSHAYSLADQPRARVDGTSPSEVRLDRARTEP